MTKLGQVGARRPLRGPGMTMPVGGLGALLMTVACAQPTTAPSSGASSTDRQSDAGSSAAVAAAAAGPAGSGDFDGWCAKGAETSAATGALATYFTDLCDNGKATPLFNTTLVNLAYAGSGDPRLKYIQPLSSDSTANTTTAYFGVGIKLPISIQQHFDVVGPKEGTADAQNRLAAAQQAQVQTLNIKPDGVSDKYRLRGWHIHMATSQTTGAIKLVTDTESNNDQYDLEKGSLYMYTTVTNTCTQTIKDFRLLTAGMQVNGTGYLLTVVFLKVGDFGLHDLAQSKIQQTALGLIKSMYQAASAGQGVTDPGEGAPVGDATTHDDNLPCAGT